MFHALTAALKHMAIGDTPVERRVHHALTSYDLNFSRTLRHKAVDVLKLENVTLDIGDNFPALPASALLKLAAADLSLSPAQYCKNMLMDREWGGGPEIIALCNYMQLPIHVYELKSRRVGLLSVLGLGPLLNLRKEFGKGVVYAIFVSFSSLSVLHTS